MKFNNKLIIATAVSAVLSGVTMAQDDITRELKTTAVHEDCPVSVSRKAPSQSSYQTQLVGFLYYADSWNDLEGTTPMGIYTIDSNPGSMPEPFARIGVMNSHCNGGAVLAGDTFWYIWRQTDPTGESGIDISQLYSYNVKTGEFQNHGVVSSELASNADHAWDPVENKIYGQYTVGDVRKLCVVDYQEQTVTPVGDCYTYFGLAFDGSGQLWGIDNAGDLYKVNKSNGSAVKIGSTGIVPRYAQTMAFDHKTNVLYWASYTNAGKASSNLYQVNTATAKVTLVTAFLDQEEFMGLGVMPALANDNAPGYVTDLKVEMQGASVSGKISFKLPSYAYMGGELTGDIGYVVYANGNKVAEGKGQKGLEVVKDITLPAGEVKVSVVCSNQEGEGPAAVMTQWVGEDYPVAPRNVKVVLDEYTGKFTLTWDAVTLGLHGGYINPENIAYTVTRFPDNKEVAREVKTTSFEEVLAEPDIPVDYWYEVKALNGFRESDGSQSNHVPFGKGFQVPYYNYFNNSDDARLFYSIDGNGDGYTWGWSSKNTKNMYVFTGTDVAGEQDDWLITPGIDMKAGNRYELKYNVCENMNDGRFVDIMEVKFGKGIDPAEYEVAEEAFISMGRVTEHVVVVSPKEDGYYHFGFHAISNCKKGLSIAVDDIRIDVLAREEAPAGVTGLSLKSSQGTAPVTIKFTTPTKRVDGKDLDKLTKVEVFRNTSELVKSVDVVEPGKSVTITDSKGARGMTTYTVVAYNEAGIGERVSDEIYLGIDFPGTVSDLLLVDDGKGGLRLTWKAPTKGANGGWCDSNNLKYNVYSYSNGFVADVEGGKGVQGTEFRITSHRDYYASSQSLAVYVVSAVNSAGEGNGYQSNEVILGQPYAYPFVESWVNGNVRHDMWYRMNSGTNGWLPEANYASDNDGGCMAFDAARDGDLSYVCLGKVNMVNAQSPKLVFDYYAVPGYDMYVQPQINLAFNGEFANVDMINFKNIGGEPGWREAVVDLSDFKTLPNISVRFLGKGSVAAPLRIDNVRIMDSDKAPNQGFGGVDGIFVGDSPVRYYDLNGFEVSHPQKGGIYIVRTAEGKTRKVVL